MEKHHDESTKARTPDHITFIWAASLLFLLLSLFRSPFPKQCRDTSTYSVATRTQISPLDSKRDALRTQRNLDPNFPRLLQQRQARGMSTLYSLLVEKADRKSGGELVICSLLAQHEHCCWCETWRPRLSECSNNPSCATLSCVSATRRVHCLYFIVNVRNARLFHSSVFVHGLSAFSFHRLSITNESRSTVTSWQ